MKKYAGIGASDAPRHTLEAITELARSLDSDYILRTGWASSCDRAFVEGSSTVELYTPWGSYASAATKSNPKVVLVHVGVMVEALELAQSCHPYWHLCNPGVQLLHARSAHTLLGPTLDDPVDKLFCWTHGGVSSGLVGVAIHMAIKKNIPVINLYGVEP